MNEETHRETIVHASEFKRLTVLTLSFMASLFCIIMTVRKKRRRFDEQGKPAFLGVLLSFNACSPQAGTAILATNLKHRCGGTAFHPHTDPPLWPRSNARLALALLHRAVALPFVVH